MKKVVARSFFLAFLAAAALSSATSACVSSSASAEASGSAQVTLSLGSALDLPVGGRLDVTVSGTGITPALVATLAENATGYSGTVNAIPAGSDRMFAASLFDAAGAVVFTGQVANVTIDPGKTAIVQLFLQPTASPTDFSNRPPTVGGLFASSLDAKPGDAVRLAVVASDADGDAITYRWTATDGTFDDASSASPIWTAGARSAMAAQTLSVAISDPHGASTGATVTIAGTVTTGSAALTASVNAWPVLSTIVASSAQLDVGNSTQLSVTATDPDGPAPTQIYWQASGCEGSMATTPGNTSSGTFTLTKRSSSAPCTVTAKAFDSLGGLGLSNIVLQQGAPPMPTGVANPTAAVFDEASQSVTKTVADAYVSFHVKAHTASGGPAVLTWRQTGGAFKAGSLSADGADVVWYGDGSASPTITAYATDPVTLQYTQKAFTVTYKTYAPVIVKGTVTQAARASTTTYSLTAQVVPSSFFNHACSAPGPYDTQSLSATWAPAASHDYSLTFYLNASICSRTITVSLWQRDVYGGTTSNTSTTCATDPTSENTTYVCNIP